MNEMGAKIKQIRLNAGLDQNAFAEIFGVSRQTISNWETDRIPPGLDLIIKIADYGKISIDELLGRVDVSERKSDNDIIYSQAKRIVKLEEENEVLKNITNFQSVQSIQIDETVDKMKKKGIKSGRN